MRNLVLAVLLGLLSASVPADTRYFAVYWRDVRVGYYRVTTSTDTYEGKPALRTETHSETTIFYLTRKVSATTDTTDFASLDNRPLHEVVTAQANGRTTWKCDFKFGDKGVEIDQDANGTKLHTTLPLPSGPLYYDEPALIAQKCAEPGDAIDIPFFAAGLGFEHPAFVPVRLRTIGSTDLTVDGKPVKVIVCEEKSSDFTHRNFYVAANGEEIRFEYPAESLVYTRVSKEFALSPLPKRTSDADFAYATAIPLDPRPVPHVDELAQMRVLFQNFDLSTAPSDESQTVVKGDLYGGYSYTPDNPWSIDVHPPQIADSVPLTIEEAAKGQEQWTKPDMFMPSDDPKMKELAAKIVAKQKTVIGAVLAIKNYVGHLMKPQSELGVPRDAVQILRDRTGTCSDYTVLTVTLLRAAGIAARAVSGLVTWDKYPSELFMHGWAEAWDGKRWIGVDATDRHDQLSACHIKLWEGDMASRLSYQMGDISKARATIYSSKPRKR